MSIISNSFKKNAGSKFAKSLSLNTDDVEVFNAIVEAWIRGFEVSESMFTEQE